MMDSVDVKSLDANKSPLTSTDLDMMKEKVSQVRNWGKSPFPKDDYINDKIVLFDGNIELMSADAIVNPTNESLTQLGYLNKLAGPELEIHLRRVVRSCATGDVRLTSGFRSNFKYILHAVPPKYQPKYKTAAESALFHTYFRILETMIEKQIRTVIMPTLVTARCNLPIEENIHLQLRIIRRILEKNGKDFDRIVVHVSNCDAFSIPFFCYFPRQKLDEEISCYYFQNNCLGGPNGEPVIPEREIRIKSKPSLISSNNHNNSNNSNIYDDHSIDLTSGLEISTCVGKTAFSKMRDDLDLQKSRLTFINNNNNNYITGCGGTVNKNYNINNGNKHPKSANTSGGSQVVIRKDVFRGCSLL